MVEASSPSKHQSSERTALQIVPSTDSIASEHLRDTFERFHALELSLQLEVRLLARDGHIEYYVCPTAADTDTIEHVFHRLFPDSTEIETATLPTATDEEPAAALELHGRGERRSDWQTRLRPVVRDEETVQFPLASVVDVLADIEAERTVAYQAILTPKPDWQPDAEIRIDRLKRHRDTFGQRLASNLTGEYEADPDIEDADRSHRERIESIRAADTRRSFVVNARAIASGPRAEATLREVGNAFRPASGRFYGIRPRVTSDDEAVDMITEQLRQSECIERQPLTKRLTRRLPVTSNRSPAIICDPATVANFCLLDGASLSADGRRTMEARPAEQTGLPRPDETALTQYDKGMLLGYPLTTDDTRIDTPVSLPPSLQPLHAAWFGKTGSGKSTALINAILDNYGATEGADILVDPKGDGMPVEYLQAHYQRYGDLENVYYFDCTETLPAISFFDIRDLLADGIDRTTAVEDITDHYIEVLVALMGRERFEQAVRSPDIIRYLVKAMFDPVHGGNAFSHETLQDAAARMHETRDPPPVVDKELQRMLSGVAANSKRSFDELMQGVANRIEKVPLDERLRQLFNHVPEGDDARFDFREVIDEDAVVIIDTGGLRTESQRAISLVLLSELWNALRRRQQTGAVDDHPLVNLYLEEAATIASSGLVTDLLAQSRAFDLSMTLAMQFPAQLRLADHEAYAELLNNVSTVITGNVAVDEDLAKRLATEAVPPGEVANRLRALRRGQWFASLPSAFGVDEPRPFLLESAPIPPGHPESEAPVSAAEQTAFDAAMDVVRDQTRLEHGIDVALQARQGRIGRHRQAVASDEQPASDSEPASTAAADATVDEDARLDSALPFTKRLPEAITYDDERHALHCASCEARYDPTSEGMANAIRCCHSLETVTRDDVPICELNLKLSVDERRQSPYTDAQLRFLQAVHTAHQRRFDPDLEYDPLYDSMIRLQEYVGVSDTEVEELIEAGLLAVDCTYPHKLYTVTPEGRDAAKISYREGIEHGEGAGDLGESTLHVVMVELGRRYVESAFVESENSSAVDAVSYHETDEYRLDAAGLDEDGEVVVAVEAERSNHDTLRAVPKDFDKMAAHNPEAAIWVVKNREGAHDVLEALNDPPEGEPRVEKEYSRNSPPKMWTIDTPGLTEVVTFQHLRDSVLEDGR